MIHVKHHPAHTYTCIRQSATLLPSPMAVLLVAYNHVPPVVLDDSQFSRYFQFATI